MNSRADAANLTTGLNYEARSKTAGMFNLMRPLVVVSAIEYT